jgi:hypothetical protein
MERERESRFRPWKTRFGRGLLLSPRRGGVSAPINLFCRGLFHSSLIRTSAWHLESSEKLSTKWYQYLEPHTAFQSCDHYDHRTRSASLRFARHTYSQHT